MQPYRPHLVTGILLDLGSIERFTVETLINQNELPVVRIELVKNSRAE
jgi:hypothetical protein